MGTSIEMSNRGLAVEALIHQLLDWLDVRPRTYRETMEAWRTTCPRLSVWEDALAADLVEVTPVPGAGMQGGAVRVTAAGAALLRRVP